MYSCVTTTNQKEMFFRKDRQGKKHRVSRKKMEQLAARFDKAFPTCEPSKALLLSNTLAALAALQQEKADLSSTLTTKLDELSSSAKDLEEKKLFLASAQAEIQQAKDLILGLEGKVKLSEDDITNLKTSVSDLRFDLEKALKEKEEINTEYGVTKARLLQEIATLTDTNATTQGLLDKEQMQVESLTKSLQDLEQAKKIALDECNETIVTISNKAQADLAALNKVLNDKTSEHYLEITTLKGQYAELQQKAAATSGELAIAKDSIATLQSSLRTEQEKSVQCAANVQTIQSELDTTTKNLQSALQEKQKALVNSAKISGDKQRQILALATLKKQLQQQLHEAKTDLAASQRQVETLTAELNQAKIDQVKTRNDLDSRIQLLTVELDQTKSNLATIITQNETLTSDLSTSQNNFVTASAQSKKDLDDALEQYTICNNQILTIQATNTNILSEKQKELDELALEISRNKAEADTRIATLRDSIELLNSEIRDNNSSIQKLMKEKSDLVANNNELQQTILSQSGQAIADGMALSESKLETEKALEQFNVCSAKIADITAENARIAEQKQNEVDSLNAVISSSSADTSTRINALRDSVNLLNAEIKSNNTQIQRLMKEKDSLVSKSAKLKEVIKSLASKNKTDSTAILTYQDQIKAYAKRQDQLLAELEKAAIVSSELATTKASLHNANSQIQTLTDKLTLSAKDLLAEKQSVEVLKVNNNKAILGLKNKIFTLDKAKKDLTKELSVLQSNISSIQKELSDATVDLTQTRNELKNVQSELAVCTTARQADADTLIDVRRKLEVATFDLNSSKDKNKAQSETIATLNERVDALTKEIAKLNSNYDQAVDAHLKQTDKRLAEINAYKQEIATTKAALTKATADLQSEQALSSSAVDKYQALVTTKRDLTASLTELQKEHSTLKTEYDRALETHFQQTDKKRVEMEALQQELESTKAALLTAQSQQTSSSNSNDRMIDKYTALFNSKNEIATKLRAAEVDLSTIRSQTTMQADKIVELTNKIDAITFELEDCKRQKLEAISAGAKAQEQDISTIVQALLRACSSLESTTIQSQDEIADLKTSISQSKSANSLVNAINKIEAYIAKIRQEHDALTAEVERYKQEVFTCQQNKDSIQVQLDSALSRCTDSFTEICLKDEAGASKCFDDLTAKYPTVNSCFKDAKAGSKCIERILSDYPDIVGLKIDEGKVTTILVGAGEDLVEGILPTPIPIQSQISETILPLVATNPGLRKVVDSIDLSKKDVENLKKALDGVKLEVEQSQSKVLAAETELEQVKSENKRLADLLASYETEKAMLTKQIEDCNVSFASYKQAADKQLSDAAKTAGAECQAKINKIRAFSSCTASESSAKACIEELSKMFPTSPQQTHLPNYLLNMGTTVTAKPKSETCPPGTEWNKNFRQCKCPQPGYTYNYSLNKCMPQWKP